jgi:hypothetical protein
MTSRTLWERISGLPRRPSQQDSEFFLVVLPAPVWSAVSISSVEIKPGLHLSDLKILTQVKAFPLSWKPNASITSGSRAMCGSGHHRKSQASRATIPRTSNVRRSSTEKVL